jgi:hypothetical protein
MGGHG